MTKKKFKFSELSDDAKQYVIEHYRSNAVEFDCVLEDAATMAGLFGLDIRNTQVKTMNGGQRWEPSVNYSLGYCQDDFAAFKGHYKYKAGAGAAIEQATGGSDEELQRIADSLEALQFSNNYELTAGCEGCRDYQHVSVGFIDEEEHPDAAEIETTLEDLLKDFAAWIFKRIKEEYEYQTSEDAVADNCECNEYRFDREGVML